MLVLDSLRFCVKVLVASEAIVKKKYYRIQSKEFNKQPVTMFKIMQAEVKLLFFLFPGFY